MHFEEHKNLFPQHPKFWENTYQRPSSDGFCGGNFGKWRIIVIFGSNVLFLLCCFCLASEIFKTSSTKSIRTRPLISLLQKFWMLRKEIFVLFKIHPATLKTDRKKGPCQKSSVFFHESYTRDVWRR